VPRLCPNYNTEMKAQTYISKRLLRTKEAARYLGMSPGKLRRLTQCGELPIVQHDEHSPWLYDLRDLDSHIDKSKHRLRDFY
jgi:helix-turn-helix protein